MPPLSPIGYSVKTWSLSPYPTRFGQVEREPKPMLRIPSQWHCLMEVTARPGFHLFKTDPGYNDRVRPATETSRRRRAPSAGVRSSLDSPLEGDGFELSVPREEKPILRDGLCRFFPTLSIRGTQSVCLCRSKCLSRELRNSRLSPRLAELDQTGESQISLTDPDSRAMAARTILRRR